MQQLPDCHMSNTISRREAALFDAKAPECAGSTSPTGKVLNKQCDFYQECSRIHMQQTQYPGVPRVNLPVMPQPMPTTKPTVSFNQKPIVPTTSYTVPNQTYAPRPQQQIPIVPPQTFQRPVAPAPAAHYTQQARVPQQAPQQYMPYPQVQMPQMMMAPANFQVPAYLTSPEVKENNKLRGFGVDMLRSMGKAAGQTMAHFFDTVTLGG